MDIVNFKIMSYNNDGRIKIWKICVKEFVLSHNLWSLSRLKIIDYSLSSRVGNFIIFKNAILKLIGRTKLNKIKQLE